MNLKDLIEKSKEYNKLFDEKLTLGNLILRPRKNYRTENIEFCINYNSEEKNDSYKDSFLILTPEEIKDLRDLLNKLELD